MSEEIRDGVTRLIVALPLCIEHVPLLKLDRNDVEMILRVNPDRDDLLLEPPKCVGWDVQDKMDSRTEDRLKRLEDSVEYRCQKDDADGEGSGGGTVVKVSRNLVLKPVRWVCVTMLTMMIIDKLDKRNIRRGGCGNPRV